MHEKAKLLIVSLFFIFIFLLQLSEAYAWLSGFDYRRAINITNSGSTALTDYQVLITLNTQTLISQGKMRSDCGDIRFALANNTLLSYWIESGCNTNNTLIWVRVPSIPANSNTTIYLYYGNPSATSLSDFSLITPSYIGREFYSTCLNDASFRIASYDDNNTITIYRSDTWSLVANTTLNRFGFHSYYCNSNNPFFINSTKPISVTYDNILPSHFSDDDFTSVYTDKIWVRIPRHLWICSYDNNNFIRVQNPSLNDVWNGTLNEGGCWFSGNLLGGFYYINATHPVTAQFGLEDDSVYGIVYGRTFPNGTQIYYFHSYGYTIISSLYPNTSVRIENLQTGTGNWSGTLANEGDYVRTQQITSFTSNAPEYVRMRVTSNKPVIVYTEGNGYDSGSEQIPSISGKGAGTYFVFRVGWSSSSSNPRYIRIIGTEPATNVTISGCVSTSTTLTRGQQVEYSCGTSWGLVRINSTKPVLVFERGSYIGEDISIVLPYRIVSPEPTTSIGVEETNYPPTITIFLPTNTTYFYSNNFVFNFTASDDRSSTFWIVAFLDGNVIYENVSYQNNTIITLTQNLTITKSYNFTVYANDTISSSRQSVIFTIRDFEIQQIIYNVSVYETTQQNFIEVIRYNPDLARNITSTLVWNSTNYQTSQTQNSTHFTFSSNIYIPLVQTNNTPINFYFANQITYTNGTTATINSQTSQQNILFAYIPTNLSVPTNVIEMDYIPVSFSPHYYSTSAELQAYVYFRNQTIQLTPRSYAYFTGSIDALNVTNYNETYPIYADLVITFNNQTITRTSNQTNITVYKVTLTDCSIFPTQTFQLIVRDEETTNNLTSLNYTFLRFDVTPLNNRITRTYAFENKLNICIYPAWATYNAKIYAIVRKDNYALTTHAPYTTSVLSNQTQTLTLYMLPSSYATPITFTLPDQNYILYVERGYGANFVYIRSDTADFNKKVVIYLRPYDIYYKVKVFTPEQTLCFQSDQFKIASSTYEILSCQVGLVNYTITPMYQKIISGNCSAFDLGDYMRVLCSFLTLDNLDHDVNLTIYRLVEPFGEIVYYHNSTRASTGSFDVLLEKGHDYKVVMTAHSMFDYITFNIYSKILQKSAEVFTLSLILFAVSAVVGFVNPFAGLVMNILILFGLSATGVLTLQTGIIGALTLLIIVAIIFTREWR